MNLVISGAIPSDLASRVNTLAKGRRIVRVSSSAYRFEDASVTPAAQAEISALCAANRIDHAYVDEGIRLADFRLLAIDMDSTLITIECIDEMAALAGKRDEVSAITEAAMRGEIADYAESLRQRVHEFAGCSTEIMRVVFETKLKLSPGATELMLATKNAGLQRILVSGGFTYFSSRLCEELALDGDYANDVEVRDGLLTGRVLEPVLDASGKAAVLAKTMDRLQCAKDEVIVIGDGANDIPMMQLSSASIAYHAKPSVKEAANHRIEFGSLETVLDYFAG